MTLTALHNDSESGSRYSVVGNEISEDALFNGADVVRDLSASSKIVSPIYYYDDRGSWLFEQLCDEETYYLSRTEQQILSQRASEIASAVGLRTIIELGCGNGAKTGTILSALSQQHGSVRYVPIDINRGILEKAGSNLTNSLPGLIVNGIVGTYHSALAALGHESDPKCFLFLGSSIGNLDDSELDGLIRDFRSAMSFGDYFIVGLDLDKESTILEAAYNNQTALLTNLAVLAHLNWRFNGDFDIFRYRHLSFHNRDLERMETYVESTMTQQVHLKRLNFSVTVNKGERIRTEIMRKFVLPKFTEFMTERGLGMKNVWTDQAGFYAICMFERY